LSQFACLAAAAIGRLALLVLHQPGGVDERHLLAVREAAAAMPQKGPKPQAAAVPGGCQVDDCYSET